MISIFGIWLLAANITYLQPLSTDCRVFFSYEYINFKDHTCDEVAAEINDKMKDK